MADSFDTVAWPVFMRDVFRWQQGQHLVSIKPSGGGKTTLLGELLSRAEPAPCTVVLVTKAHDTTFSKQFPASQGWYRIEEWPPPRYKNRILLWPRYKNTMSLPEFRAKQKVVFMNALDSIFGELGWTIVCDEEHYLCKFLGLTDRIAMFHHQGRSSGLTMVDGTQRPVDIPLVSLSGARHAFIGNTTHNDDLKRLADLGTRYKADVKHDVQTLDEYEFLYVPIGGKKGSVPIRTTVQLNQRTQAA